MIKKHTKKYDNVASQWVETYLAHCSHVGAPSVINMKEIIGNLLVFLLIQYVN